MLEVGNGGMTAGEYRTRVSLWVMLAAPLLAGNVFSKVTPDSVAILENRDAIAIDQDPLGRQGDRLSAVGPLEIWTKPMSHGEVAVAFFNRAELSQAMTVNWKQLRIGKPTKLRDVWAAKTVDARGATYTATVPKHGVVLLRVTE